MNKPLNSPADQEREALIAELETVNQQLHRLRVRARELNDRFLALKSGASDKPLPKPMVSTSTSPKSSKSKPKPKPLAQDDDLMLGGVSD